MSRKKRSERLLKGKTQGIVSKYDAAGTGRRTIGWVTPSSGPNTAIGSGIQKIRDRTRDVSRNDWSGASTIRVWTTNLIGTGIVPRFKTLNKKRKDKLSLLWKQWVAVADSDSVLDFYGLQVLVTRALLMSGEVFVRVRPRRTSDGLPVPMQLQVLEADFVPMLDADSWPDLQPGNVIRSGIELDRLGRRVAYWMYRSHPGEAVRTNINPNEITRVPADSVMHVFDPQRPGQLRGVSELASVVMRLRNVADFDDAVLERQKIANLFTMFLVKPLPSGANDAMTGLPFVGDPNSPLAGMEPGTSHELLPGEDVRFSDPPDSGAIYPEYMRAQNLGVAAGAGTPYELMSGDVKDVSDRTLRIVVNEFRRLCEQRQWTILIPKFCQATIVQWAYFGELSGVLSSSEADDVRTAVVWSPQGWQYIHPVQDVQAKQAEVEGGFRSRSSVIAERGDDPEEVDAERAADQERAIQLGLSFPPVDPNAQPAPSPADKAVAAKARAEENLLLAKAQRELNEGAAEAKRLEALAKLALADAELKAAEANEALARVDALKAKTDLDVSAAAAQIADLEHRRALAENESAERVQALKDAADAARKESDAKAQAFIEAEAFAKQQRDLVLATERKRAECASLEAEAARVGLAELQGA